MFRKFEKLFNITVKDDVDGVFAVCDCIAIVC